MTTSAFGVVHKGGWNPASSIADPTVKGLKLARGRLVPAKAAPKRKAEAVTPWSRYLPGEAGGKHKVGKSFIPGKGFVAATKLTGGERRVVSAGGTYKTARGVDREDAQFSDWYHQSVKQLNKPKMRKKIKRGVRLKPKDYLGGGGETMRLGGKNTGRSVFWGQAPTPAQRANIEAHEAAHARPRRSAYRVHHQLDTVRNPKGSMREEARADWEARGHFGRHPQSSSSLYAAAASSQVKARVPGKLKLHETERPKYTQGGKVLDGEYFKKPKYEKFPRKGNYQLARWQLSGHFGVSERKAKQGITAYRKLHNDLLRRGVRQPPRMQQRSTPLP